MELAYNPCKVNQIDRRWQMSQTSRNHVKTHQQIGVSGCDDSAQSGYGERDAATALVGSMLGERVN